MTVWTIATPAPTRIEVARELAVVWYVQFIRWYHTITGR